MPPALEHPEDMPEVQNRVFLELLKEEPLSMLSFVIRNGALFRQFAENLNPALWEEWEKAAYGDTMPIPKLKEAYKQFRKEVEESLAMMFPETMTAFTESMEAGNIDTASKIIEAYFQRQASSEEADTLPHSS